MWPEIELALKENRHELILSGSDISERIENGGIDINLFSLTGLNLLRISDTILCNISPDFSKLINLQCLLLHSNKITEICEEIGDLNKLKNLDLSRNQIQTIPTQISELINLVSLNAAFNKIELCPDLSKNCKLSVLDLSNNNLTDFSNLCASQNSLLSELNLKNNKITSISTDIFNLQALKILNLTSNSINVIPGELSDCSKLKEVYLQENPVKDKRLLKLIAQCRSKQVLDYVKQHCPREKSLEQSKNGKKTNKKSKDSSIVDDMNNIEIKDNLPQIIIQRGSEEDKILQIKVTEDTKAVRPYILGCVIKNIVFTADTFRKFIQMQTKLHDSICDKRNLCTIATHDYQKIKFDTSTNSVELIYKAVAPNILTITPLGRKNNAIVTGAELFQQLKTEAENLRKEKKRSNFSGIHKYLHLLEDKPLYPCVAQYNNEIISLPPLTNSEISKIDANTTSIFVEVTSSVSYDICRRVLDQILRETSSLKLSEKLIVEKVKITDVESNLKCMYPSKNDVTFNDIHVIRE